MVCKITDPVTGQPYGRDPRYIAQKAENHLKASGIADTASPRCQWIVAWYSDIVCFSSLCGAAGVAPARPPQPGILRARAPRVR
jgi:hypothetical protein